MSGVSFAIRLCTVALLVSVCWGSPTLAESKLIKSILGGDVGIDLRFRYERVEQADLENNANANTIRLRLGYTTGTYRDFFARAEFQGNWSLGPEDYNSTENGKTDRPVVADPQDSNFSQLLLGYRLFEKTEFLAGRQEINLDNQRFVGTVAWRQLEQTFDSVSVSSRHLEDVSLFYAYVGNVIRVFGEHHPDPGRARSDQNSHLLNAVWNTGLGKLSGYGYLLDFEDDPLASTRSFGLRFSGSRSFDRWRIVYAAELADQSPHADGDPANDARYAYARLGGGCDYAVLQLGYELLGGDGSYGFQTPLATLHKFNGWADKFLFTPPDGLQDLHVSLSGNLSGIDWAVIYHDFDADEGGTAFGDELDLEASHTWRERYTAAIKFADYDGDGAAPGGLSVDTQKFWFWLSVKL